jgi:hypothetical protein
MNDRETPDEPESEDIEPDIDEEPGDEDEEIDRAPQPGNTPAPDEDVTYPR